MLLYEHIVKSKSSVETENTVRLFIVSDTLNSTRSRMLPRGADRAETLRNVLELTDGRPWPWASAEPTSSTTRTGVRRLRAID